MIKRESLSSIGKIECEKATPKANFDMERWQIAEWIREEV